MKNKLFILISILIIAAVASVLFIIKPTSPQSGVAQQPVRQTAQAQQPEKTLKTSPFAKNLSPSAYSTGLSYDQAVKAGKPMVVNFYVDWCHYCQGFAPKLEELRLEYKDKFNFVLVKADDPNNQNIVQDFNISGYPSLFLVNPKNDNRVFINQSLYDNKAKMEKEFNRFLRTNK